VPHWLRGSIMAVLTGLALVLPASFAAAGTVPATASPPATAPAATTPPATAVPDTAIPDTVVPDTAAPANDADQYGKAVCGANAWDWVETKPRMVAHDSAGSCVKVPSKTRAAMSVTKAPDNGSFPNISSGYELNENSCPSGADMKAGLCDKYPVEVAKEGNPVATFSGHTAAGYVGNFAFDTYFTAKASNTSFQGRCSTVLSKADVEVMVWLSHPGDLQPSSTAGFYTTTIDGRSWHVYEWETPDGCPAGEYWRLVIFTAPQVTNGPVAVHNLKLNDFFSYAIRSGWLRLDEYLLSIDLGWEMKGGGAGNAIDSYSLTGVK
jgi:Glycosyl hydrolase family 12